MITITESEMTFGPFPEENVFQIEKSPCYNKLWKCWGVKTCEFILLKDNNLFFIEAKSSSPRAPSPSDVFDRTSQQFSRFRTYITDIAQKMTDSLNILASILLNRASQKEDLQCPDNLRSLMLAQVDIVLVLVIKNAKKEWLFPLQDALNKQMKAFLVIWNIRQVLVINETMLRKKLGK